MNSPDDLLLDKGVSSQRVGDGRVAESLTSSSFPYVSMIAV